MKKFSGKFIVLDGPDGCGKSTQCKMLAQSLQQQGVTLEIYRDPGDTAIGEKIRQILLNPEHQAMSTRTELLLYMAARVQLWQEKIAPALQGGKCVILDRWLSSTCAYQGYAGEMGIENVIKIAEGCLEKPWPDLTVILDLDLKTASRRLKHDLDRMEQKGQSYHQKVRQGFLELAKGREKFTVVDSSGDIETTHTKVLDTVSRASF
jgi:dTMP kinase